MRPNICSGMSAHFSQMTMLTGLRPGAKFPGLCLSKTLTNRPHSSKMGMHQRTVSRQSLAVRQSSNAARSPPWQRCLCTKLSDCGSGTELLSSRWLCLQGTSLGKPMGTQCARGLRVSEEVREAVHAGKAVVALESTIITHGMPHPHNEQTAQSVEQVIRDCGAVPATVGVLHGTLCVGLSGREIHELCDQSKSLVKVSRRDLPFVMAQGMSGGTTVSGTLIAAHAAGIPIFATGGVGGVHRGVEHTMDVSADLREMGRTPVAVVAAGVKSILDIPRTLEYLETEGVCVVTYGPSKDFPAFFAPRSGQQTLYNVQSPRAAADIVDACRQAQLESGILFAVPIPEEFAASGETIDAAIHEAIEEARRSGVTGKDVTPFILQRVNELTQGVSLDANIVLMKNNAAVAAHIAVALSMKTKPPSSNSKEVSSSLSRKMPPSLSSASKAPSSSSSNKVLSSTESSDTSSGVPVVVGGAVVDFCAKVKENDIKMLGATYVGKILQSFGGVGRNVADCLSRLGNAPLFVSALGDDLHAAAFMNQSSHMNLRGVRVIEGASTPTYCPVLTGSGQVMFGIGDMDLHSVLSPTMISEYQQEISEAPIVCVDGNFSAAVIERVCQLCASAGVPVWFEPTDVHKACKPLHTEAWKLLTYISPNLQECAAIWSAVTGRPPHTLTDTSSLQEVMAVAAGYCRDLLAHIPVVMVTLGRHGLVLGHRKEQEDRESPSVLSYYPAIPPGRHCPAVVSVSGAGDCLNAAMIRFIIQGHDLDLCVKAGLLAAQHSLQSHNAVPASITADDLTAEKVEEWAHFRATDIQ